jgi:hypothetical protein
MLGMDFFNKILMFLKEIPVIYIKKENMIK